MSTSHRQIQQKLLTDNLGFDINLYTGEQYDNGTSQYSRSKIIASLYTAKQAADAEMLRAETIQLQLKQLIADAKQLADYYKTINPNPAQQQILLRLDHDIKKLEKKIEASNAFLQALQAEVNSLLTDYQELYRDINKAATGMHNAMVNTCSKLNANLITAELITGVAANLMPKLVDARLINNAKATLQSVLISDANGINPLTAALMQLQPGTPQFDRVQRAEIQSRVQYSVENRPVSYIEQLFSMALNLCPRQTRVVELDSNLSSYSTYLACNSLMSIRPMQFAISPFQMQLNNCGAKAAALDARWENINNNAHQAFDQATQFDGIFSQISILSQQVKGLNCQMMLNMPVETQHNNQVHEPVIYQMS